MTELLHSNSDYAAMGVAMQRRRGYCQRNVGVPANWSHLVSSGNLTPFGKGERAVEFEDLAAAKMTFLVKMVVDRSMDRNEFL